MQRIKSYEILGSILFISIFFISAYISQKYSVQIKEITSQASIYSIVIYISMTTLAIVVAPLSSVAIIPVASNAFGPFMAGLYSILGWFIGSILAFHISRTYLKPSIEKYKQMNYFIKRENTMKRSHFLLFHIFMRMAFPVDLLSYALGVLSKISFKDFIFTTLVGITPFAFLFSYGALESVYIQIFVFLFAGALSGSFVWFFTKDGK